MLNFLSNPMFVTGASWDISTFLQNSFKTLDFWFNLAIMIVGLVLVVFAVWQISTGLISQGKKQTNWALAIVALIVGGMLSMRQGWAFVRDISEGGRKTIEDLGSGTIAHVTDIVQGFLPFM